MTHPQFLTLLSYHYAKKHSPKWLGTSRRLAKRMGKKAEGRVLVPLEKHFINPR